MCVSVVPERGGIGEEGKRGNVVEEKKGVKKILFNYMVWLKGGVLFSAIFCYSGHLDFFGAAEGRCYFLLFWGRRPTPL